MEYESLLTSENFNTNLALKAIEKNFTSDSRDNSIANILYTIGENKINREDSSNNIAEKDTTRREKEDASNALSSKMNTNSHWKNSSLINNRGSSSNFNFNLNTNSNNNNAINLKPSELITPKNFQNKFVLLDSAKEISISKFKDF